MTDRSIKLLFLNQRLLPMLHVEELLKPSWEVIVFVCTSQEDTLGVPSE